MHNEYYVHPNPAHLSPLGFLKPAAYLEYADVVAEQDLGAHNASTVKELSEGKKYVITGAEIKISKPVTDCLRLVGTTCIAAQLEPYFLRTVKFTREGEDMFEVLIYSIDITDQSKASALPKTRDRALLKSVLPPSIDKPRLASPVRKSVVSRSDVDCYGHVNNGRYPAFCFDSFDDETYQKLPLLKGYCVRYSHELTYPQEFTIYSSKKGDSVLFYGGTDKPDAFSARFDF